MPLLNELNSEYIGLKEAAKILNYSLEWLRTKIRKNPKSFPKIYRAGSQHNATIYFKRQDFEDWLHEDQE